MTVIRSAALLAVVAGAAQAQDLTPVSFATNWVAQAEHGGYYQAVADGTYEACGLDVTIEPGGPQVSGQRISMAAGKIDFLMGGNMLAPWDARKEGIPVKVVAAHFQKEPQVLLSHPGVVSSFEDLANLDELIIGDAGYATFYQWLITDYGFKAENRVPYTFNPAPFIANESSAQQGYITSEPFAIEREAGWTPDIWLLADYGFTSPSTTVETMETTIAERPEVVKCFVEGSSIGWATYLYGDNTAANDLIKADNPDMTDEQIAYSIEKLKEYGIVDSGIATEEGIGSLDAESIGEFYRTMVDAGVMEEGLDWEAAFTTEFSNTGAALETKQSLGAE